MSKIYLSGPISHHDYSERKQTFLKVQQALEKKGYLAHEPKGRGFVYRPIVDKQAYGRGRLTSVVNRFFSDSYMSVVSALIQEEKVTEADLLQYLADLKRREG